jgi:hypothetical protein
VAEMSRDVFEEVIKIVFNESHSWVLINQRYKRIYKGFDEIIVEDDDDEIEKEIII